MFRHRVNQNGEVFITGYTGNDAEVIIPSEIDGKPVKSIGMYAFWCCNSLTSVTIPDSVTSIGAVAFQSCSSLKDVWYSGTEERWGGIAIESYNHALNKAKKHFKIF